MPLMLEEFRKGARFPEAELPSEERAYPCASCAKMPVHKETEYTPQYQ
jgi:hypothetical protein